MWISFTIAYITLIFGMKVLSCINNHIETRHSSMPCTYFNGGLTKSPLTHWGRVTHICIGKLTIIDSDDGLPPGRRQAIIWSNAGVLLIGLLGANFREIFIGIQTLPFNKMHLKMSSAKRRPFCLGLNVLKLGHGWLITTIATHACHNLS